MCELSDKSCAIDPLPTVHLKAVVDVIAPFLTELFNRSLSNGVVPEVFKAAYIIPRLKKSDTDPEDVRRFDQSPTCRSCPSYWRGWWQGSC